MGRADLTARLGGGDFAGYRRLYWVEALEVSDGSNLQESVSVQAVFGGFNPFAEADSLTGRTATLLGKSRGVPASNTARDYCAQASSLDNKLRVLHGAREEWDRLEAGIADAAEAREHTVASRAERSSELASLRLAVAACSDGTAVARAAACQKLTDIPAPSEADRALHAQTTLVITRITELEVAEAQADSARHACQASRDAVDHAWRHLIDGDEIGEQGLAAAEGAERRLRDVCSQAEGAEAAWHSADRRRQASEDRFSHLAEQWSRLAPDGLAPDVVHPAAGGQPDEPDLRGAAVAAEPPAPRGRRGALAHRSMVSALVLAAVCIAGLVAVQDDWARWLIAGVGSLALGAAAALVMGARKPLDPELVDLARRYQDARSERDASGRDLRERQQELDTLTSRADTARHNYRQRLRTLNVPDELFERFEPGGVEYLKTVRKAQSERSVLNRAEHEVRERLEVAVSLLAGVLAESPPAAPAASPDDPRPKDGHGATVPAVADAVTARRCLHAVGKLVEDRHAAEEAARKADDSLKRAVQYDEAALAYVEGSSLEEMRRRESEAEAEFNRLEKELKKADERISNLELDKRNLESPEKTTAELSLERDTLLARIESRSVLGLAHGLAARLLRDAAERHRTEQQPELLMRTQELACAVADWHSVNVNPDTLGGADSTAQSENLLVEGPRGKHSDHQLSLGAQTLLYLALRLATVEGQAKARGVRLPLILDDVLIGLDDERAEGCLGVLAEFSEQHQIILLTCHDSTAERAAAAGAAVMAIPPSVA